MTATRKPVDISIVVVNWNVATLLDLCLASITAETAGLELSVEVIVVDNHSDEQEFRTVVANYPEVRLLELEENRGYGAACNVGIGVSQGRAVLLLNPDTELLPGSLELLWETLNLSPHIGLVAPLLLNPDGSIQSSGYRFPGAANVFFDLLPAPQRLYGSALNGRMTPGNGTLPYAIDYALGAALLGRRSALLDVGMFNEHYFMYSEEVDLQRRLAENGWTRLLAPDARVLHHGGQSTGQQPAEMRRALWESRARYFEEWASSRELALIRGLVNAGTRLDDLRHSHNRELNRRIRARFARTLARS